MDFSPEEIARRYIRASETAVVVHKSIFKDPPEVRQVLLLASEGESPEEISDILNMPLEVVLDILRFLAGRLP